VSWWQAVVFGALQGATEFLPVSSSGHLVVVPWLLGWESVSLGFGAAVHLGTLVAVAAYFRRDLWALLLAWLGTIRRRKVSGAYERLSWLIAVGTVPGVVVGVLLEDWFETMFSNPLWVSGLLLVTGGLLALSERVQRPGKSASEASLLDAVWVGLGQAMAIAPGISRSGATMAAGLMRGLSRPEAARFSFLLAVPIVAGAGLLEVSKFALEGEGSALLSAGLACVSAAGAGFLAVDLLMRFLRRHSLTMFAWYCWSIGGICLFLAWYRG